MKKAQLFLTAIVLIQATLVKNTFAHFSSPSFKTPSFSQNSISHSDSAPQSQSHSHPAPFVSKGNPNLYTRDRADELRYRNVDATSRCLHLEKVDPKFGTQNPDIPNMRMKFENPGLRGLNFNAE